MKSLVLVATFLSVILNGINAKPIPSSTLSKRGPRAFSPRWKDTKHLRPVLERRDVPVPATTIPPNADQLTFEDGEPQNPENGYGDIIVGPTNHEIDLENPDNLGRQSTDAGTVVNLKWRFSDSKTGVYEGGWTRKQVVQDLPPSTDISSAQQHLSKGSVRDLHWHRVAEWGYVYAGQILLSAVNENGENQIDVLSPGDIWYFPKGVAHAVQGLGEENEFLLAFDDGDFNKVGTTFNVADWIDHTPSDILAQNFGVDESVFDDVPNPPMDIYDGTPGQPDAPSPYGPPNSSYVFYASQGTPIEAPGGGGSITIVDSTNFPVATTIAAAIVVVKPGGLRELHWHPNEDEWLFFMQGSAQATVFLGPANARTFDFLPGDTAVFPDNSGHYVKNTGEDDLIWIELYKSDQAVSISLRQFMALTPHHVVEQAENLPASFVDALPTEAQLIVT